MGYKIDAFIQESFFPVSIGNYFIDSFLLERFLRVLGAAVPIVTLQSETRIKISDEAGATTSTVIFRADQNCDQWEARAGGSGSVGSGLLVGSGGAINANTDTQFDVDWTELTNGDITYPIDVFAHNATGWSVRNG
jgi:hypothetical protein